MNVDEDSTQIHPKNWVILLETKLFTAARDRNERKFGVLYTHVCNPNILEEAWKRVRANRGAPGIDRRTIAEIESKGVGAFLLELQNELRTGSYQANVIRRVYIPKGTNGKRPLGIPTVKDRVVQMAVKTVIEPIFEADFCETSFGFRPGRSNKQAVNLVYKYSNTYKWVVDVDLKSYFDTIDHNLLMKFVQKRISDRRILKLIRGWLKCGIMEDGKITNPELGTPQGSVISPLLSNIFLHELDKKWDNNPSVKIVRFADDMVIMCKTERQAYFVLGRLKQQVKELKVTLNMEKTKIVHVRDSFDFLGFTIKEAYSYGKKCFVRIRFPRPKSMQKVRTNIKEKVKSIPLSTTLEEVVKIVNRTVGGWANYFRIGNSYKQLNEVSDFACQQLRIFMRRKRARKRSQCTRRWDNSYFYGKGLIYAPYLLKGRTNAA